MKKYLLAFAGAFLICPCPIHGTLLGAILVAMTKGATVAHKRCADKRCSSC
jgi:hypothetical protein